MTIVFFGNTKYSLIGAKIIHQALTLSQIVTIPDRPDKRGSLIPSPLKTFGQENNIPVMEVNKITTEIIEELIRLKPDFLVVEDYGLILPQKLLEVPKVTCLNIHHSLLPKYRGPSPAPTAILNGDKITGVTVMKIAARVDAGDILAQEKYEIKPNDTTDSLLSILNEIGAKLAVKIMQDFDNIKPISQKEDEVIFTQMLKKEDGFIDLNNPPEKEMLDRMIRAYFPWPTVWTLLRLSASEGQTRQKRVIFLPGNILQVEGKNPMSVKDFLNGYPETKKIIENLFGIQKDLITKD